MGKETGFLEYKRENNTRRPVEERIKDYKEYELLLPEDVLQKQGARCMNCGLPFCHNGCPLGNIIPDWNDLVYRGRWKEALKVLESTNSFPEITGRICPAPCEQQCVLFQFYGEDAVTIKQIEKQIANKGKTENWIEPQPPIKKTGKKVAVVGSGPSGLAGAQQLARAGHQVTVFEKDDKPGGLMMYGIPDFKLEKHIIWDRVRQMEAEGVSFRYNVNVGQDLSVDDLKKEYDAVLLTIGAQLPRKLTVEGSEFNGVHLAMDYLPQQNKRVAGEEIDPGVSVTAKDKIVVILGGGDTGADCLGTAIRQGAKKVYQYEILPKPDKVKVAPAHEEGVERDWSICTKKITGNNAKIEELHGIKVNWRQENGRWVMEDIPGTEFTMKVDMVLLAMGFLGPITEGLVNDLQLELNPRKAILTNSDYMTSVPGVFAAGDAKRGASLVVWAIWEGREAASCIDKFLMGYSELPTSPQLKAA